MASMTFFPVGAAAATKATSGDVEVLDDLMTGTKSPTAPFAKQNRTDVVLGTPVPGPAPRLSLEEEAAQEALAATRLAHARELMGKYYRRSVVKSAENVAEVRGIIEQWTARALKGKWSGQAKKVSRAIIEVSRTYKFDPVFVMAVIENESSFNPTAVGTSGEIGLMQIRPATAKWVADMFDLAFKGEKTLRDPVANIKIGAAYLAYLREKFDSDGSLYLAAYNMGTANVRRALGNNVRPKEYTSRVMQRYVRFYTEMKATLAE